MLYDTYEFDKIIKNENYSKSNPIYDANQRFYRYYHDRKKLITFQIKAFFSEQFF